MKIRSIMEFDIPDGTGPTVLSEFFWNIAKIVDATLIDFYEVDKSRLPHELNCFLLWREKPKGLGEAAVIIVPMDDIVKESYNNHLKELLEIFDSTTDSEETIKFNILELDH